MASQIKFIFFDMGKVLLNFDHQRLIDQTAKLSGSTAKEIEAILFQPPHDLENRFERGELNSIEFHQSFCEQSNCQVDHNELMLAIADIFWLNTPIVHVVAQLQSINFPMAVLSNTCSAHWEFAIKQFAVLRLFQQRVLSYEEQSMKPDAKYTNRQLEWRISSYRAGQTKFSLPTTGKKTSKPPELQVCKPKFTTLQQSWSAN